jgi:hypothetical protein
VLVTALFTVEFCVRLWSCVESRVRLDAVPAGAAAGTNGAVSGVASSNGIAAAAPAAAVRRSRALTRQEWLLRRLSLLDLGLLLCLWVDVLIAAGGGNRGFGHLTWARVLRLERQSRAFWFLWCVP